MLEDQAYRTSSQYRYWSYTREGLASLRQETNHHASERVRTAIRRARDAERPTDNVKLDAENRAPGASDSTIIETLSVQEELKLVSWFSSKIIEVGGAMEPPIPMEIRVFTPFNFACKGSLSTQELTASTVYSNSVSASVLHFEFPYDLPSKTDYDVFASRIGNTTEEDVKAPEFLLMQGLRFTLDVRHPMRALEGGVGEILAMIQDGSLFKDETNKVASQKRVGGAADCASNILRSAAQMTDAYFLYTPSQIWLAALQVADSDLANIYLTEKLGYIGVEGEALQEKLIKTLSSCAELLASYKSPDDDPLEAKEMKRLGKKLHLCQNPEKVDLVAVTRAKAAEKREGADGSDPQKALKKRRLEHKSLQKDGDVFGPELKSVPA